jgi:hypothetical protein
MSGQSASVLTDSQRKFVSGKKDPSNHRVYKQRIRKRIEYGLHDLGHLFREYDPEEIRAAFGGFAGDISPHDEYNEDQDQIPQGGSAAAFAPGAVALLLQGLNHRGDPIYPMLEEEDREQPALAEFREAIEEGIRQYLREKTPYLADVNVSIDLDEISHTDEFLNLDSPEE